MQYKIKKNICIRSVPVWGVDPSLNRGVHCILWTSDEGPLATGNWVEVVISWETKMPFLSKDCVWRKTTCSIPTSVLRDSDKHLAFFFDLVAKGKILSFFLWGSYTVNHWWDLEEDGTSLLDTDLGTSYAAHVTGSPEIPKTKAEVSHMATSLASSPNSFKWTWRSL